MEIIGSARLKSELFFICYVFVILFLLVVPDILFSIFNESFVFAKSLKSLLFITAISVFFVINKRRKISIIILSFFAFIQVIQFCHIKYFGTSMSPSSLYLMMKEMRDVIDESMHVFWSYIYVFLLVITPFFAIFKFSCSKVVDTYKCRSICGVIIVSAVFLLDFLDQSSSISHFYAPNALRFSLDNSIKTFLGYINVLTKKYDFKKHKLYSVKKIKDINEPMTIVYIIGESTNHEHMSLFGYKEDTTPELKKLSKSKNVYYNTGIAGSITTISSCKFICNAIREPNNVRQISLDTTNLFKLAKEGKFKTFYISAQRSDVVSSIGGVPYIDVLITREQYPRQFSIKRDSFLLELIKKQKFTNKNFIVIHQRCIHSPYAKTIPKCFNLTRRFSENKNCIINEYNNAMFYNDSIISGLFNIFNKDKNKFYIFWASDHNELTGKNDIWGHGHLNPLVAQIPIIIQSNDNNFLHVIRKVFAITHYDICCAIAGILGFDIINPNEEKAIYYISGVDYSGKCGYIKFKKDEANKKVVYSDVLYD